MKITDKNFYNEVSLYQCDLMQLPNDEFFQKTRDIIFKTYPEDGDVSEMFPFALAELGKPESWHLPPVFEECKNDIAKLAAIQHTFGL